MELTPKLPVHKVVPLFTLLDKHGDVFNFAKQRGRAHVLLLIFAEDMPPQAYLQSLAKYVDEWKELPARAVVVMPDADAAGALGSVPFAVLIDEPSAEGGKVQSRFLPDGARAGVFALDRYGDLYQQWLVSELADLPSAVDLNGWLQAISMQCSI